VSRAAKGADCKSAGLRLRRFESYLSHHLKILENFGFGRSNSGHFHVAYVARYLHVISTTANELRRLHATHMQHIR
jgi:hypothetical protein